ncbi:MFS transporter [Clostridium sp. UBA1056]|uniref:MFS transporter n=1 Tax=unclassified Clostridium TaxID=2614128 RepID=UPI0032167754
MKKNKSLAITIFIFIIMAVIAIVDNTKGIFVPVFKETFNTNNTSMGMLLSVCSLGYIIFTYVGGILCEKFGQRKVIGAGLFTIVSSVLVVAFSKTYTILLIGMFLINVGIAFVMIGVNTLIPVLFITFQAIMMNSAHCFYGFGSTVGQFAIGSLLDNGIDWRNIFFGIAMIFIAVLIIFFFIKIPKFNITKEESKVNISLAFKEKYMYIYAIGLGTYVFAEMGMSNWIVNFLMESYNFTSSRGAMFLSAFFFLLTIGRLLGGFVAEKLGYLQAVLYSLTVAVILLVIALSVGHSALILICIAGLFFAIAYPTVVATIGKVFKDNSSYITGLILTLSSTISMILNLLMGRLNDIIGTTKTFYLIPISLSISILFIFLIYRGNYNVFKMGGNKVEQ